MNSKRQRRPNVRLGEIGDVSAAFAFGASQPNLGHKRLKHDFGNPKQDEHNPILGFSNQKSPEFTAMDDPALSPRISADLQHNMENKNPNSSKTTLEFVSSDKIDMTKSKVNFGTIIRKSRDMKRKSRSTRSVFGSSWNSKLSPPFSSEDGNDEYYPKPGDGLQDLPNCEAPGTSKGVCENDVDETTYEYDAWQQGNSNDSGNEDACYEGNNAFLKSATDCDKTKYEGNDVNIVKRWLEKLGFGKYADVFEMHEVDEETLPLLTLEDLKEMGVFAVGHRRKLYNAIQKLRGEGEEVSA